MKIVIDIPNRLIKKVKDHYVNPYEIDEICEAILDGTPLPEHHGRLIDADAYISNHSSFGWLNDIEVDDFNEITPTIIEGSDNE